ncbi:MAG: efflux RND transporter permease subunit [Deltaproteobacteria bacterium]|nr:efflux RND transporter permease subunit [Deltaproteobacteria bacterium]
MKDSSPAESSSRLTSFSTRRPVAILVIFLAAGVFGYFSYDQLPVTLMPELSYPTLTVRTEFPGAAPEEVENDVSRPVEEALGVIGGLQRISSISRAGVSDVVLEFTWDTEMSKATQDVLENLDLVFLPEEADRPLILRYDPSLDPIMEYSLAGKGERFSGEEGLRRLRRLAELQVKRELEPIKGIAAVRVRGGLEEEIHVRLDEVQMRRSGLAVSEVIQRLRQENINVAGGTLREGRTEYMVRTLNEYQNLQQIEDTVLARIGGREIRISDVGQVEFSHKERQIHTRTGGAESVQIEVLKEADANIVALAKRIKKAVGEIDFEKEEKWAAGTLDEDGEKKPSWAKDDKGGKPKEPEGLATTLYRSEGVTLSLVTDRSTFIESSIDEVVSTAVMGGLLAVLVLFVFLRNARSTAIVALSIPISLLITFAPLQTFGISLNIMSLGGLALGVGMLVDSSIVVLESIFRCREEGEDLVAAAVRGTFEVRGAVAASTLTSIAVFFPMVFVEGIAGQAFGDLGLAVVVSLLASLAVAVFFIPMLASRRGWQGELSPPSLQAQPRWASLSSFKAEFRSLKGIRWLLLPYLLIRTAVGLVLEFVGKLLMALLSTSATGIRELGRFLSRHPKAFVSRLLGWFGKSLDGLQRLYPKVLGVALRHAGAVALLSMGVFAFTAWATTQLDSELLPEVYQGELTFEVSLPVGTPLEETEAVLAPVEQAILQDSQYIEALVVTYGFDPTTSQRSDQGEHSVSFKVMVERPDPSLVERLVSTLTGRPRHEYDLRAREEVVVAGLRQRLREIPDLGARVKRPVLFSFRTPVEVEILGDDLAQLKEYGENARARLAELPDLADVETSLKSGAPEVRIVYDRDRLARYGLNIQTVAELVRDQVKGFEATRFNLEDRRVPVIVRLAEADRETVKDVRELWVNPGAGKPIPLAAVATAELGEGPSEVRRVDGQRVALITANLAQASLGRAVESIEGVLFSEVQWPSDMTFHVAGQNEEWQRSQQSLWLALALSIFLVYVIMAAQFESLVQPLIIMATIPLAFFGSVLALLGLGIHLSVVVFLGMIMLAGIVVNNAIVLVDYINTLKTRGLPSSEAILTASRVRLRPILMTTATTALGLLPMAIGLGDGSEIRTPMAITVITGLIASTALTLIVVPVAYSLVDRMTSRLSGRPVEEPVETSAEELQEEAIPEGAKGSVPPLGLEAGT